MAEERDETARLQAFSDGVFAVGLTLLVFELHLPDPLGRPLLDALLLLWPKVLSYALSFATVLIMWVNHHGLFRSLRRVDAHILFTNGLLLLLITFVPFPTAVLGDHLVSARGVDAKVAAAFYALTYVAINLAWALMWHSIAHQRPRVAPGMPDEAARRITRSLGVGLVSYLAAAALALVSAAASVSLCMLLAVYWTVEAFRHHPEAAADG